MSHYICHKAKFTKLTNASTQHSANMPPYKQNCFIVQIWMLFSVSVSKRNTILEQGSDWILKLKNSDWRPALVSFFLFFFFFFSMYFFFVLLYSWNQTKKQTKSSFQIQQNIKVDRIYFEKLNATARGTSIIQKYLCFKNTFVPA